MNNFITFDEYSNKRVPGCIREREPKCPFIAVIPSVTVSDTTGIKNLSDCFVHVTSTNTTFYIDDKHRIITTWAGPVEVSDYDHETNPSKFASQLVVDTSAGNIYIYGSNGTVIATIPME